MNDSPRKLARRFRKQHGISRVTSDSLCDAIEAEGFTVIPFDPAYNDDDTANVIRALGVSEYVRTTKGFTFANEKYRLVFVHSGLSEKERQIVLSHEAGHIVCNHFSENCIMGRDVTQENEANEFSHYICFPPFFERIRSGIRKHKILTAVCCAVLVLSLAAGIAIAVASHTDRSIGEYYVTATGKKYHRKECIYVRGKDNVREMTEEEFDSGFYSPCSICFPNGEE